MGITRERSFISVVSVATIVAAMAASGCGRKQSPTTSTSPQSDGASAASSYAEEVDKKTFPAATSPPTEPLLVRWDFSGNKIFTYDFTQKVAMLSDMNMGRPEKTKAKQKMLAVGSVKMKSQGDGTANLVLKVDSMKMNVDVGSGNAPDEREIGSHPPMVVQGVTEDGGMTVGDSAQATFIKLMFPMPPKALSVGESDSLPATMPFNAMGSALHVKGQTRITLTGYVNVDGKTCARLEAETDISELDVPEELEGTYECKTNGKAVFYYDPKEKAFVSGSMALMMRMHVDAPSPKFNMPKELAEDMPSRAKMSMVSDNLMILKRSD